MENLCQLIERMPKMEGAVGIQLAGLYAECDDNGFVSVRGEVNASPGTNPTEDFEIAVALYNNGGQVIASGSYWVSADTFLGFDVFSTLMQAAEPIARIRVFPKR